MQPNGFGKKIGKFDRLHIHYLRVEYFSFIKNE
ncbi:hypothetical protein MHA_2149 [Mannheimia haemolytica PHL213]|nr:hypothetical protein MHA_2149 [Mannheimia haemolytica PHL213]